MNNRSKKRKTRVFQVGVLCALNILFCPTLFAATRASAGTRASLNAINANIENSFIEKQSGFEHENSTKHYKKPYDSEPFIFGSLQRQKADTAANIAGYHVKTGGVGYLAARNLPTTLDLFEVGGGATYSESHSKIMVADTLKVESGQIIGFANVIQKGYFLGLFLAGTENWSRSKRVVPSTLAEARARYKGAEFFSKIRIGHMSRRCDWQFTPEASLQYVHLHQGSYNETGADTSNLSASSSSADGIRAGIGGRVMYIQPTVTTEVRAFYLRDFKNPLLHPTFRFTSSGTSFASGAQNNKKDNLNLGASLRYFINPYFSIAGNYDFLAKKQGYTENNASLSMNWNF